MKKYILTGGPGTGKSSIILALEQQGEYTIREAAEDYIRLKQAQGQKEPWTEPDFQEKILDLQIQREKLAEKTGAERIFMDRGRADGLAYAKHGTETYRRIEDEARKTHYDRVFLIENLGTIEKTQVRRENLDQAIKLEKLQEQNYRNAGYEVIRIPPADVKQRAIMILEICNRAERGSRRKQNKEEK